jgi:hypothetical protein
MSSPNDILLYLLLQLTSLLSFNVQLLHGGAFVIYVNKQQNLQEEEDRKHCVRGGCARIQQ